jgi:hypothetical protein
MRSNVDCKQNSAYTTFYNNTWRHERCHVVRAIDWFESDFDPRTAGEEIVRTTQFATMDAALWGASGLATISDRVMFWSDAIDTLGETTYNAWKYSPTNAKWWFASLTAKGAISAGC